MSVQELSKLVEASLNKELPTVRKTVTRKVAAATSALVFARSVNTAEIANCLPVDTENPDYQQRNLGRLLSTDTFDELQVWAPYAKSNLEEACCNGQKLILSMDQSELGHRHAILMVALNYNDRGVPLAWHVEAGQANIGAAEQIKLLEHVKGLLPEGCSPILMADRFYPSAEMVKWLKAEGWDCRIRLKSNCLLACADGSINTVGSLKGRAEYYDKDALLFEQGIQMGLGYVHDKGHKEGWAIAMLTTPTRASVMDYSGRWSIEPMFSDYKSRGFDLQKSQMKDPKRLSKLLTLIALAIQLHITTAFKKNFVVL